MAAAAASSLPARKAGYLKKRSPAMLHQLQRRFFVLAADLSLLSYYATERDTEPKGAIPLESIVAVRVDGATLELDAGYRRYHLVAASAADADEWRRFLQPGAAAASGTAGGTARATAAAAPTASPSSATRPAARSTASSRPGVVFEGYLLKSPPQLSVRRVKEQTRLQQRWFILSNRSLSWYSDATQSRPLSSVPLALVLSCSPKRGGGKHEGKFYVATATRKLKLVAADAPTMSEWVGAINGARAMLADLRDTDASTNQSSRYSVGESGASADGGAGGALAPDCVRAWCEAHDKRPAGAAQAALGELAMELACRVAEEFAQATQAGGGGGGSGAYDIEALIEVADRCGELMCGVLDEVLSHEAPSRASTVGGGGGPIFGWYLSKYHSAIFSHLGGACAKQPAAAPPPPPAPPALHSPPHYSHISPLSPPPPLASPPALDCVSALPLAL